MKFRCSEYSGIGREMNDGTEIEAEAPEDAAEEYARKHWEDNGGADGPLDEVFVLDDERVETAYVITTDWEPTFYARART